MALYYTRNGHSDKILYVGDTQNIEEMNDSARHVMELQADGHELEAIERQFTNIPMSKNRVVTWYGDTAKFIAKHFK